MTQFQLQQWRAEGLCSNPQALIDVIDKMGVVQRRTGNKAIAVHGRYVANGSEAQSRHLSIDVYV